MTHFVHYTDYTKGRGDVNVVALAKELEYKITAVAVTAKNVAVVMGRHLVIYDLASGKVVREYTSEMPAHHLLMNADYATLLSGECIVVIALVGDVVHAVPQSPSPSC